MHKLNKNESGFGIIQTILILIIVGIIGFVGWYVWSQRSNNTVSSESVPTNKSEKSKTKQYSNKELDFTLIYPNEWGTATLADGPFEVEKTINYKQLKFSKQDKVSINFVIDYYSDGLDGCGLDDPVKTARHYFYSKQASVIGWSGDDIKKYRGGKYFDKPTVVLENSTQDNAGAGWTEIGRDDKVLIYKDLDNENYRIEVASEDSVCGPVTQAQADEANAYLKYFHFAVNFSNTKVKGVNAQYDARQADDPDVRAELTTVLNSLK